MRQTRPWGEGCVCPLLLRRSTLHRQGQVKNTISFRLDAGLCALVFLAAIFCPSAVNCYNLKCRFVSPIEWIRCFVVITQVTDTWCSPRWKVTPSLQRYGGSSCKESTTDTTSELLETKQSCWAAVPKLKTSKVSCEIWKSSADKPLNLIIAQVTKIYVFLFMAGTTVSCSIKANDDNNLFEYTRCFLLSL